MICEPSTYSPGQAEDYSLTSSSDIRQLPLSSGTPTAAPVLRERADEGWFPGLHVLRARRPAVRSIRIRGTSGLHPCRLPLPGHFNRRQSGWHRRRYAKRTLVRSRPRCSHRSTRFIFLENVAAIVNTDLTSCSPTLPAWGSMQDGFVFALPMPGAPHLRIDGGSWATPTATYAGGTPEAFIDRKRKANARRISIGLSVTDLQMQARIWPSPGSWRQQHGRTESNAVNTWAGSPQDGRGWWTEPDLGRVAHGVAARVDRLKSLGNGQVPLQAALAWRILAGD